MKKKRILSFLLALLLVCALVPVSATAAGVTEVSSADEMLRALADTPAQAAGRRSAAASAPIYVLVLEPTLPDACGAQRVLHYAAYDEYILEFASLDTAEQGYRTLTESYGLRNCWLDTPEQGARVLDGSDGAAFAATTWGASHMHLDTYKSDVHLTEHLNAVSPIVAIIDSGVDPDNAGLAARSVPESYDFVNNSHDLSDVASTGNARGHGTRVASIMDSVLPESVRFMYLRVFDETQSAARVRVITAVQYAAQHGADVINLSLGWEDDQGQNFTFLDTALRLANANGATVVCAAGNEHQDVANCYPASSPYTISVSAVGRRLTGTGYSLAYEVYSNYGEKIDFCAPGSGITATTLGGSTVSCTGTSFSAPHITAAVAMLKLLEPTATPARVYTMLHSCADDIGVAGKDNLYGWGIPILPDQEFEKLHTWDISRTVKAATATENGTRELTCSFCGKTKEEEIPATGDRVDSGFVDVPTDQYYAKPVTWAAANSLTSGPDSTHFAPHASCTRAQVVTVLWRPAGSPEPKTQQNPFYDVPQDAYFYDAVLWAVENGITKGTSDVTFAPDDTCTRAHVVTFLWRFDQARTAAVPTESTVYILEGSTHYHKAGCSHLTDDAQEIALAEAIDQGYEACPDCWSEAGPLEPVKPDTVGGFEDVLAGAYYADAVLWAVENGVTTGMTPTTFEPNTGCSRAHVVTFLYRYYNQEA